MPWIWKGNNTRGVLITPSSTAAVATGAAPAAAPAAARSSPSYPPPPRPPVIIKSPPLTSYIPLHPCSPRSAADEGASSFPPLLPLLLQASQPHPLFVAASPLEAPPCTPLARAKGVREKKMPKATSAVRWKAKILQMHTQQEGEDSLPSSLLQIPSVVWLRPPRRPSGGQPGGGIGRERREGGRDGGRPRRPRRGCRRWRR